MRYLLTTLFFFLCLTAYSQINWKRELVPISFFFVAGSFEGTAETLKWHYDKFEKRFSNSNSKYWNPEESWTRKYKDGNPINGPAYFGSTTFLVWTTDGYHLSRTTKNTLLLVGMLFTPDLKGQRWWVYLVKASVYSASYMLGFHLTYSLIFK